MGRFLSGSALAGNALILPVLFVVGATIPLEAQDHPESKDVVVPEGHWRIGSYDVRLVGTYFHAKNTIDPSTGKPELMRSDHQLQILRDGVPLGQIKDYRLFLSPAPRKNYMPPPFRANVIGTATPNIVAYGWSGGAHCCFTTHVFDLGDPFRKIDTIDTGDYEPRFLQLDDDPALEIKVYDTIYGYWRTGFSDSVAPEVVLKFDAGKNRYAFSPALMRRPPPAETELQGQADAVRALPLWTKYQRPPPKLWEVMLDLIYAGNYPLARPFLDRAWNDAVPGKEEFWDELIKCQMRESRFWPDIAALNGLVAAKPEGKCPGPQ